MPKLIKLIDKFKKIPNSQKKKKKIHENEETVSNKVAALIIGSQLRNYRIRKQNVFYSLSQVAPLFSRRRPKTNQSQV
ncbi:hypothetical protein O3M35_007929 [Rhynocoris fuscipes]|uniref:Ribosomal protein S7 n=1 Tax=Rhynocoris fuscipes TaxID=488301 RepID=A0AAW1DB16_9HEMI